MKRRVITILFLFVVMMLVGCGQKKDADNRGTLKVTDVTPEDYPAGLGFLEEGNYHLYDYQFFYRNLQQNVERRIDSWFQQ